MYRFQSFKNGKTLHFTTYEMVQRSCIKKLYGAETLDFKWIGKKKDELNVVISLERRFNKCIRRSHTHLGVFTRCVPGVYRVCLKSLKRMGLLTGSRQLSGQSWLAVEQTARIYPSGRTPQFSLVVFTDEICSEGRMGPDVMVFLAV